MIRCKYCKRYICYICYNYNKDKSIRYTRRMVCTVNHKYGRCKKIRRATKKRYGRPY